MKSRIDLYFINFEKLSKLYSEILKEGNLIEKFKNTKEKGEVFFNLSRKVSSFIINLINYLHIVSEKYYSTIKGTYYYIISVQFLLCFLSLVFVFLVLIGVKSRLIKKVIGNLSWILSGLSLIVMSFLLFFMFFFGSLASSLASALNDLGQIQNLNSGNNNSMTDKEVYRCFNNENSENDNNWYVDSNLNRADYFFEEMNTLFQATIDEQAFSFYNVFDEKGFLISLKKYLEYIDNSQYASINITEGDNGVKKSESIIGLASKAFERLINTKNSFPIQFYLECHKKIKIQIVLDQVYCEVPLSTYTNEDDLNNRFCYSFADMDKNAILDALQKFEINKCPKTLQLGPDENISLLKTIIKRFEDLKKFYDSFEIYKKHFYNNVIKKIYDDFKTIVGNLTDLNQQLMNDYEENMFNYAKLNMGQIEDMMVAYGNLNVTNYETKILKNFTSYIDCTYMNEYPVEMENSILHVLIPSIYSLFICSLIIFIFNIPLIILGIIAVKLNS